MFKGKEKLVWLAVVLVLVIVLGVYFTGMEPAIEEPEAPVAETPQEPQPEPEPEPEPEEVFDFGGRTIRVSSWGDITPKSGTPMGDRQVAREAELEEKFNVSIEWVNVPWDVYLETLTASILAGDPIAEKVELSASWFYPLQKRGFLQPLEELYDLTDEKWVKDALEFTTIDGRTYGLDRERPILRGVLFFNKAIFEREGLPNPYELVANKQWTWDKMIEIAKQATRDLDGDGVIDQWGLGGGDAPLCFVYSNLGRILTMVDGKPTITLGEPNAQEGLQAFYDAVNVHKVVEIPPEGAPWDYDIQRFQDGKLAMFPFNFWIADRFAEAMADDYGVTLFPIGPRADEFVSTGDGHFPFVIPRGVEHPEQVAMIYDRWTEPFPEELEDPDFWFLPYLHRVRDEESVNTMRYSLQNDIVTHTLSVAFHDPVVTTWWGIDWELTHGFLSPATIVEERLAPLQASLDDIVEAMRAQ